MNDRHDLTRWNRAGLRRFRYVDGNAVTYLETLRRAMQRRIDDPGEHGATGLESWPELTEPRVGDDEVTRLRNQYHAPRRSLMWEIFRASSRALHGLGESLDDQANEGYLATANRWENVRRLVAMLDYSPAPPSSATTMLVFEVGSGPPGTLEKGFQVEHPASDGGPPVIFETLADAPLDPSLDKLRPAGWNRSRQPLGARSDWKVDPGITLTAGQPALLLRSRSDDEGGTHDVGATAVRITDVHRDTTSPERVTLTLANSGPSAGGGGGDHAPLRRPEWTGWPKGEVRLLVEPRFRARPQLHGEQSLRLDRTQGLSAGDVIAWQENGATPESWHFARVTEVDGKGLRLDGNTLPASGSDLWRTTTVDPIGDRLLLPPTFRAAAVVDPAGGFELLASTRLTRVEAEPSDHPTGHYWLVETQDTLPPVWLVPGGIPPLGRTLPWAGEALVFDAEPETSGPGSWSLGRFEDGDVAVGIETVEPCEAGFTLTLSPPPSGPLLELDTDFAHALVPEQNDLDTSFLAAEATLELETVPSALRPGAHILLHDEEGRVPGFVTRILALDDRTLVLDPPLPPDHGFRAGTTSIRGNLALAGHGAARPQVILGSGDATRSAQSFVLDEPALSFVPDPGQPRGVRPDVEVTVGRQIWSQVPNFRDSEPTAPHFTTSMTEGGGVRFTFGDGEHGRRLPSGRDNVRVRYRSGNGAAGNLDAGSASKTTRPHPLVAAVHQPLDAAGGNAMEPVESLRSNAPASVLTLGRAVSLRDFEYLAAGQAGLWQARAFVLPTGPRWRETVEVVVVPAGGRPLDPIRRRSLAQTLEQHALPGVGVEITPFVSRPLHLDICLCVRTSEYSPTEVEARVRGALAEAFSLRRRRLGQDVFASQVIQVVEGIEGVESSRCLLALPSGEEGDDIVFDPTLRRLRIDGRAVCHLDHPLATSNVRTEEPAS